MRSAARYTALVGILALGLLVAALIGPSKAHAYTILDLPNMGFGVLLINLPNGCHQYKVGWHNDRKTDLGSDCDPAFQAKLDAFMAANCPPAVCPELVPTVTVTNATTAVQTVTTASTQTVTTPAPDPVTVPLFIPPAPDEDASPPTDSDPAPYVPPSPPVASFTDTEHGLVAGFTDTFGVASVTWSFGDGANGAGPDVSHRYARSGLYVVIETVIDTHGLAAQSARTVTVALATRTRLMPLG